MSRTINFIKECGTFFVLTMNGDFPAGRPFGAIMEQDNDLYISTADMKEVYAQIKQHPEIQIIALKNGTRNWIRVSGVAEECFDMGMKQKMLTECPVVTKHFAAPDALHYSLLKITVRKTEFYE